MTSFAMVMFLGAMASAVFFDLPIQGILISAVLWLIFVVGDLERSINRAHNLIADIKEDLAKRAIEEVDGVPLAVSGIFKP